MVLNSAKTSILQYTITLQGSGYLMSHANSTILDVRSTRAEGTVQISIQPVAGSIIFQFLVVI